MIIKIVINISMNVVSTRRGVVVTIGTLCYIDIGLRFWVINNAIWEFFLLCSLLMQSINFCVLIAFMIFCVYQRMIKYMIHYHSKTGMPRFVTFENDHISAIFCFPLYMCCPCFQLLNEFHVIIRVPSCVTVTLYLVAHPPTIIFLERLVECNRTIPSPKYQFLYRGFETLYDNQGKFPIKLQVGKFQCFGLNTF